MHDDEKREGRDELNLAEWPIAVVGRRSRDLTVTYEDTIRLPNGAFLHRRWVVSGTPEYGLPGPLAQDVYLALMELSKENHFASPRVEFSLRDLCRRLGRASGGQSIKQVKEALECFTYTTIHAENAFWDNKRKVYESKTFHILDEVNFRSYEDGGEECLLPSYVRWSEYIYTSFQAGYLKHLDLRFYFALKRDLARTLYRYLDKHRYDGKKVYRIGLSKLTAHLGMAPAYPSQWKQRLEPAHEELTRWGFFQSVHYEPGQEEELVVYRFGTPKLIEEPEPKDQQGTLPLQGERVAAVWARLTDEDREALTDEALERLTPVVRELNRERRDSVWVLMEVDQIIRERFLKG